ncbi:MAG: RNA polymerase sigma factor SigZ [Nitrospirota bacterium]|nr:MAG: RNA polymerase sigma factor SigZ [Nitrospirota bacterium]
MPLEVNQIWMQVQSRLRDFIARRVPKDTDVDDILQEVGLRMHRSLNGLKDPGRIISWVFQITRNVISDFYRSPKHRREIAAGSAADLEASYSIPHSSLISESPESQSIRKELAACLLPMIKQLPDRYGEALMLVEIDGLTQKAAAHQLRISLSGMKSRVQRGRKELKHLIEECCVVQLDRRGTITDYSIRDADCNPCEPSQN